MSSWSTRNIPRKRDLSQIPEHLRPQIVPRAAQPQVLISESFQESSKNEIIMGTRINQPSQNKDKAKVEPVVNPRQYVTKKIDLVPAPGAFELVFKEKSYVFVILRHIRSVRDNDLWISSYNSIRKYYTNKIIIIDDNSAINTVDGKLNNAEIIKSEFNGAGEILPYYYFLKYKWADRMIFLHDSMFINRPFRDSELEGDIKFHWQFDRTSDNDYRKINNFISLLTNNTEIQAYVTDPDTKWNGCFGATSICNLSTIEYLENEYKIFSSLVLTIRTRKDRETFERVLGIILYYEGIFEGNDCSNFGNILKYPGAFESENNNMETAVNILRQRGYDSAIIKVWRGR
jgi:hypothetical protein